jgi:hypothetical protein
LSPATKTEMSAISVWPPTLGADCDHRHLSSPRPPSEMSEMEVDAPVPAPAPAAAAAKKKSGKDDSKKRFEVKKVSRTFLLDYLEH